MGVLVVSSKREIYTARLSFIWVMKKREEGGINWSLGLGKIPGLPPSLNETWCVNSPVVVFFNIFFLVG